MEAHPGATFCAVTLCAWERHDITSAASAVTRPSVGLTQRDPNLLSVEKEICPTSARSST
ncbi:protein of unknown function [Azospirillum baldaniorum]|uniref:Uncharacterized protein n=1 Tax=Azospirillum baldaniorum TaxID=1064539 RepID=A0A9P1JQM5_9PROT|nr:protein of unknown function [Azospirillum baldaniorum]